MNSLVLQTASRIILVWMLLFSFWVLFRGHNAPGGGFSGGLIGGCALALYLVAHGVERFYAIIKLSPFVWLGIGLALVIISGFAGVFLNNNYCLAFVSPALLFDVGVYFIVCFSVVAMLVALEND